MRDGCAADPADVLGFQVSTPDVTVHFRAFDSRDRQRWILALTSAKIRAKQRTGALPLYLPPPPLPSLSFFLTKVSLCSHKEMR